MVQAVAWSVTSVKKLCHMYLVQGLGRNIIARETEHTMFVEAYGASVHHLGKVLA